MTCTTCRDEGAVTNQGAHRTQGKAMPTCQQCRKEKLVSMFRTTRGKKSEICKECEQITWAGCAREKPNAAFDACTVKNYWALGQQAVCDACKKTWLQQQRPQALPLFEGIAFFDEDTFNLWQSLEKIPVWRSNIDPTSISN